VPAKNSFSLSLDPALVDAVDKERGTQSRSALVEALLREWLSQPQHRAGRPAKVRDIRKPNSRSHRTSLTIFLAEGL